MLRTVYKRANNETLFNTLLLYLIVYTFMFTEIVFGCQQWRALRKLDDEDSICSMEKVHKNLNLQYSR